MPKHEFKAPIFHDTWKLLRGEFVREYRANYGTGDMEKIPLQAVN